MVVGAGGEAGGGGRGAKSCARDIAQACSLAVQVLSYSLAQACSPPVQLPSCSLAQACSPPVQVLSCKGMQEKLTQHVARDLQHAQEDQERDAVIDEMRKELGALKENSVPKRAQP